ncbi:carrier protein [Thecamonas trahens ATCC 50062]|uniref:Carrier protein n=1 Tax=Thecamonas trahens ATCC 50062 TaxID=461836 RepID=A0A0L0DJH6_THETB|nr:carrier protein [Thecamonas trahens ATCC 50062]KNC52360.1 carrier protein [Thecamonas trahens ATCC 50062]|eukprot:XP_013755409.1 carrier protein [Thecamonas trahens ATCC 50062]
MATAPTSPFAPVAFATTENGGESGAAPGAGLSLGEILSKAGKRAIGGGLPGAAAMGVQVISLMWLRTVMNVAYARGGGFFHNLKALYAEGGIRRFYRGLGPALAQGPLSRAGDTAANELVLSLFESNETLHAMPMAVKTAAAAVTAAAWRINLMPIDAAKTTLQVQGRDGLRLLMKKVRVSGFGVLYHGAAGAFSATWVGYYPWFFVFNTLQEKVAVPDADEAYYTVKKHGRNALIGFAASATSDCISNSLRVIKTTKQTSPVALTYPDTVRQIIRQDGVSGLFLRGLSTRLIANAMQGAMFSLMYKAIQDRFFKKE